MCLETMLDTKHTAKFSMKNKQVQMIFIKKEYIVDQIEPAISSTLGEQKMTVMSKLVKEMTPCRPFATWTSDT